MSKKKYQEILSVALSHFRLTVNVSRCMVIILRSNLFALYL